MKIVILDNYDSFTFNLVHYVEQFCEDVSVKRNNQINLSEVQDFDSIILSPGPGLPKDAGIMPDLIREYSITKKILGVCLGHQAIGEAFGCKLKNLDAVHHGVAIPVNVSDAEDPLFNGIPGRFETGRYHSWVIKHQSINPELRIIATDDEGEVMAVRHNSLNVCGVQFHPESLLTEHGLKLIENWIRA